MNDQKENITLIINGIAKEISVSKHESLMDVLRRNAYWSVKSGCDTGDCGVCNVLLDGKLVRSCKVLASNTKSRRITTVEGITQDGKLHPIQTAFIETGAIQCGYCTPALVLAAKALLDSNPEPSDTEVRDALSTVLCRCTGYDRIINAVEKAAGE